MAPIKSKAIQMAMKPASLSVHEIITSTKANKGKGLLYQGMLQGRAGAKVILFGEYAVFHGAVRLSKFV
jgi:hypothetical protein